MVCLYQFTIFAREVVKSARTYVVKSREHLTFWPQQTGKQRRMTVTIGDLPGETKPFDFASTHCTMLQMDNKVTCLVPLFCSFLSFFSSLNVFFTCSYLYFSICTSY